MPLKVGIGPVHLGLLAQLFMPSAHAMARPPQPGDPPGVVAGQGRPHLIPPDQLTTYVGSCHAPLPWEGPDQPHESPPNITYDVPWPRRDRSSEDGTWLGVYLYTPHYKPITFAIQPPERSLRSVLDTIQAEVPGVPPGLFDKVVPLRPQRFQGYASFLRCPRVIHHSGTDGFAAVVCDLSRVGGHYFATTLPKTLDISVLVQFLLPLTKDDDSELQIFVGMNHRPWPASEQIVLCDGAFVPDPGIGHFSIEPLFQAGAVWGPISDFFTLDIHEATCILHENKRYTFKPHYHYDMSLVQYICQRLRLRPEETVMCTFEIKDLDVHGVYCRNVVAVHDVPSPLATGVTRDQAQDLFALLDFRPLGMRPYAICVSQPKLHIPTIAANFGLLLPPATTIEVAGGTRKRENVRFEGHARILFYAGHAWLQSESSSDADPSPQAAEDGGDQTPRQESALQAHAPWESSSISDTDQLVSQATWYHDPTLPEGHSWNLHLPHEAAESTCNEASAVVAQPPVSPPPGVASPVPELTGTAPDTGSTQPGTADVTMQQELDVCSESDTRAQTVDATCPIIALIYVPDTIPEVITIELNFPTAVPQLLAAVETARADDRAQAFPNLSPVSPQLTLDFAILVAAPEWLTEYVVVLMDCRRIEQGVFAVKVPHCLSRESLLLAAGLPADMPARVFVHGLLHPLTRSQRITLVPGMAISVVPPLEGAPICYDLPDRLVTTQGWNHEAELPGPRNFFGTSFRVLTDAWPLNFQIQSGRRGHFRADLTAALGAAEHRLSIRASRPRLLDVCSYGLWTTSLLVATEQIHPVPFPPARRVETRIILILDLRKILQGITWQLVERDTVSLSDIAATFFVQCPFGHKVLAQSASNDGPQQLDDRISVSGQVVEILFSLDPTLFPALRDDGPDRGPTPEDCDPQDEDTAGPTDRDSASNGAGHTVKSRSRSPRGGLTGSAQHSARECLDKWSYGTRQDAFVVGSRSPTPALHFLIRCAASLVDASPRPRRRGVPPARNGISKLTVQSPVASANQPSETCSLGENGCHVIDTVPGLCYVEEAASVDANCCQGEDPLCGTAFGVCQAKWLSDPCPDSGPGSVAFNNAREATRQLGAPWPHPPFRWQAAFPAPAAYGEDEAMLEDALLVDVTCGLLTPGYTFERVDLSMLIPQALPDAIDLLQTCRRMDRRELFPELIEVRPQPAIGWGLFLALPSWVQDGIIVCLDLSSIDGRVFAERVPRHVDLWTLLSLADLPFDTDVEVHVPDFHGPLPRGADCEVYMGCCIIFLPPGVPPVYLDLMRMLRSPDEWNAGPGLEHTRVDNGYCIAAAAEYFLFRLVPERSMYYRQDIAASAHIHPSRLQIIPAATQQQDVLIAGWAVKTVLAAVPTRITVSWSQENEHWITGLLDARPALLGWMPLQTQRDWLDLAPLAASLLQSAPPGFQVVFPAFPRHWTWIWFTQGQNSDGRLCRRRNQCS